MNTEIVVGADDPFILVRDESLYPHGPPSPMENANYLSYITFSFLDKLLYTGYKDTLKHTNVWELVKYDELSTHLPRFEKNFAEQAEQVKKDSKKKDRSVIWALHHTLKFGPLYWSGILVLLSLIFRFAETFVLYWLIEFVDDAQAYTKTREQPNSQFGYWYAAMLFVLTILTTFCNQHLYYLGTRIESHIIQMLQHFTFKKSLRLSSKARQEHSQGEIVNLISVDVFRVSEICEVVHSTWSIPLTVLVSMGLNFLYFGWSTLAGVAAVIALVPLSTWLGSKLAAIEESINETKDERVKYMNELLQGIRVIKYFCWEDKKRDQVQEKRDLEFSKLKKSAVMKAVQNLTAATVSVLGSSVTFIVYTLTGGELTTAKVFTSMAIFGMMTEPLMEWSWVITIVVNGFTSAKRLASMLLEEEVAEAPHMKYKRPQTPIAPQDRTENDDTSLLGSNALQSQQQDIDEQITIEQEEEAQQNLSIVFRNASFSYDSQKNVLTDVNLQVKQGEFICIVGRVGCGKSSILSALFGEAERTEGYVSVRGKLSYCCEKPWIINATIRENILFGSEFNETRYNEVVDICQLGVDMKRLPKQDLTEVGENGVNLSPGQQHRISLARAVYAPRATITLLDSTLNAVDNTVQANILQDCIVDYMKVREQRTVVLVTHSLRACEFADRIVLVEDGRISKIVNDWKDIRSEWEQITRDYEEVESPTSPQESVQSLVSPQAQEEKSESDGKLVEEEEREVGSIKMAVLYKYFAAYGIPILISCALTGVLHKVLQQGQSVWLSVWSGAADKDTRSTYYLQIYVYIGLASLVFIFLESIAFSFGNLKSTNTLHANMLDRILRARMSFFDSNPIGRILNRFTSDQFTIDYRLMYTIGWLFNEVLNCIGVVIVISYVTPWFMILIIPLMIVYYIIQMFYRATSREVRRLESISRSPLFSHVAASIRGISTIRAYACDPLLHAENKLRNDYFIRHYILRWTINRWLGIRIELIGAVIVLASSLFAVLGRFTLDPALVGLSISFSLQITIGFLMIVRLVVDAESNLTSCERIIHYGTEIPIEPPVVPDPSLVQEFYTESGKQPKDAELLKHAILPPSDWPQFGSIEFENVTVSYRPGIDRPVLNKVNLSVKEGEKIGIIGRTGAGKSTMLLTLFRFLECSEGCIKIDDFDIARVPLPDLRKHITIIPQTPVLFSGTIRSNIDVFDEFDDHQIWSALERVHIKDKIEKLSLQLLEPVSEGGSNFSIGEQALISLSRSLLYRNKIIVFDEATAHVDHHSDQLIQETIRKEFADCTTLTIAHRLDTIVDSDRVIVLDRGEVVEQGAPKVLLENTSGYFYSLVAENGDDYLRRLKDKAKKAFEKMSSSK